MTKQMKKYLIVGIVALTAVFGLPALGTFSNDASMATSTPNLIAQVPEVPCDKIGEVTDKGEDTMLEQGDDCDDDITEGNSWGG